MSPIVYNSLQSEAELKANMHNLYIQACKDLVRTWVKLSFITTDDVIFDVMASRSLKWHTPNLAELENITVQQQNKETKLHITQLVERKRQNNKRPRN